MLKDANEYTIINCNPSGFQMSRDTTKFIIITIDMPNICIWTYSEWFFFNIPCKILYDWIELNVNQLQLIKYNLILQLNNGQKKIIERSKHILLKDICSNHVVEITCTRK